MKKHFDTGKSVCGPYSGRHTICLCGIYLQDRERRTYKRKTTIKSEVTCKNCLKILEMDKK